MRRLALCAAILSATAAHAQLPSAAVPRARLSATALGAPEVQVLQPSHVAVFEVQPFGGIVQLYPTSRGEAFTTTAVAQLPLAGAALLEARRASHRGLALVAGGMGTAGAPVGADVRTLRPRTLVLLASDQPLRVSGPFETLARLAGEMPALRTPQVFGGEDADIADLVARVRPVGRDAEVTLDILSLAPDASDVAAAREADVGGGSGTVAMCGLSSVVLSAELLEKLRCTPETPVGSASSVPDPVVARERDALTQRLLTDRTPVPAAPAAAPASPAAGAGTPVPPPVPRREEAPKAGTPRTP